MATYLKSRREIGLMREAGRIVAITLQELEQKIRPGMTTAAVDEIAERMVLSMGATPAFKGYHGFPASVCISINDEIVHGIPTPARVIEEGDVVSLDFGAIYKGYYGDSAITVGVGAISPEAKALLEATKGSLQEGIKHARAGRRLGEISHAIQDYAESHGFSVIRQYVGHGIGRSMHEEPQVPNFGPANRGPVLRPGLVLAIEPMLTTGTVETRVRPDNWTVVTADGGLSAHFEHSVAITTGEPEILTLP